MVTLLDLMYCVHTPPSSQHHPHCLVACPISCLEPEHHSNLLPLDVRSYVPTEPEIFRTKGVASLYWWIP
jgi:hypothetical protein